MNLPRVTEILKSCGLSADYSAVDEATRETAMARGTALHQAIAWDNEGTLDPDSLHEAIKPGFLAYRAFVENEGVMLPHVELELAHEAFGYIGHIDAIGFRDNAIEIIDWKYVSGAPDLKGAKYQCAAYRMLWDLHNPNNLAKRCSVVALGHDGTYRVFDVTDDYATRVFIAATIVYLAKEAK